MYVQLLGPVLTEEMMRVVRAGDENIGKDAEYMQLMVTVISGNTRLQGFWDTFVI
jgi:hypothetical protein